MVIKVFISGISASKEVKKRQQRAQMLLDSLRVKYETIDITEPGHEEEKELMKNVCKKRNNNTIALPPQFFNDDQYCGDYEDFEVASDDDTVLSFLKLEEDITIENGDVSPDEGNVDMNDSTPLVNEQNKIEVNGEQNIVDNELIEEVVEEVVTVEEILTLDGKVINIPSDKTFDIDGNKIDLNELLIKKAQKQEQNKIVDQNESSITQNKEVLDDSQMDVEEKDNNTQQNETKVKSDDEKEEQSDEEEDNEEENDD